MKKTIKIIDLLNKIANGEDVPYKIIYDGKIYIYYEAYAGYYEEGFAGIYNNKLLTFKNEQYYKVLNDEVEILDEEDGFEDIDYYDLDNFKYIHKQMKRIIKNQKKIIERLKEK